MHRRWQGKCGISPAGRAQVCHTYDVKIRLKSSTCREATPLGRRHVAIVRAAVVKLLVVDKSKAANGEAVVLPKHILEQGISISSAPLARPRFEALRSLTAA